ncbi:MAG: FKBP-type peptidyl-prolyl cis-trans isomerase [Deltaproteobacteria bacterium]|nr:FKBP-type peptidyl-prolyl cis-trans isomerase [Deltaproteobacteria bacterium]
MGIFTDASNLNSKGLGQDLTPGRKSPLKKGEDFFKIFRMLPNGSYRKTDSGLKVAVTKDGDGKSLTNGMKVKVNYTGWVIDGKKFDSSYDKGKPFEFVLGAGRVIKGWEEGMAGIQPGERRQLIIPPELGYGKRQMGDIPANATLVFNVEALAVEDIPANPNGNVSVVA